MSETSPRKRAAGEATAAVQANEMVAAVEAAVYSVRNRNGPTC